jgi:Tol biopolymer transport system component
MQYTPNGALALAGLLLTAVSFYCNKDATPGVSSTPGDDSVFGIRTPFWSKDGSKIIGLGHIFGRDGDSFFEIDSGGGVARELSNDTLQKDSPSLSPDGKMIAYLAAEVGRIFSHAHVWVMRTDGTNARDLTPSGGNWGNVRWSPDSRFLIFDGGVEDSGAVNYQIAKADVQTGELRMLTRSSGYGIRDASYLSSGERIAFSSGRIQTDYGGKVWLMNVDGSDLVSLDTTRTASNTVRVSPIRNEIFFAWGLGGESDAGVYALDLDTTTLPAEPSSFHYLYPGDYFNLAQWSPDGEYLLFPKGNPYSDLYLLNRDGSGMRRLTTGLAVHLFSYAWSPDSQRLVFMASDDGNRTVHLFTYDINTNSLRRRVITRK